MVIVPGLTVAAAVEVCTVPAVGVLSVTVAVRVGEGVAFALVALGLYLISTITPSTPTWIFCSYMAVMGAGLGMSMQFLTLIVQNAFPVTVVGTATAANNFFRQVGSTVGASLVGGLFTSRLSSLLSERMPAQAAASAGNTEPPP